MPLHPAQLWLLAGLGLALAELWHGAFVLLGFAAGCGAAAAVAALGGGPAWQLGGFCAALGAELFALRPLLSHRSRPRLRGNVDAIVGRKVRAVTALTEDGEGVVSLTGEHWKARLAAGALSVGDGARVVAREGLTLIIVPEERSEP